MFCSLITNILEREREMFYLTTHSTHFIYGYMASDIWLRTILIVREETRCRHISCSYRLAARVLLYAPSHRQDNTYHGLCYTSRGALAGLLVYSCFQKCLNRQYSGSKRDIIEYVHYVAIVISEMNFITFFTCAYFNPLFTKTSLKMSLN